MPWSEERGRIVRITFEVVYPTGQLKTLAMNMSDVDWGQTALIALSEDAIKNIVGPGLAAYVGAGRAGEAVDSFMEKETPEAPFKPAMLVVREDGTTRAMCGAHGAVSHVAAELPLGQYI